MGLQHKSQLLINQKYKFVIAEKPEDYEDQ